MMFCCNAEPAWLALFQAAKKRDENTRFISLHMLLNHLPSENSGAARL